MRNGIGASGGSGSGTAKADLTADLVGVDVTMVRQLAHMAFSDFIEKLRAAGRTVLGGTIFQAARGSRSSIRRPIPF